MLSKKVVSLVNQGTYTQLQLISSKSLTSGEEYQRLLKPSVIKKIIKNYDPHQLGIISVSYRDGKYNIFDGQNRFSALKKIHEGKEFLVPCIVHYGLTREDEALLVGKIRKNTSTFSLMDSLKALYIGGDKDVVAMVNVAKKVGLDMPFSGGKGNNKIIALKAIESIYNDLGEDGLEKVLKLIKETWFGVSSSLDRHILMGTYLLVKIYDDNIDEKIFVKNLSKYEPMMIKRMGNSDMSARGDLKYAKAILECYNKKQTVKTRLEYKLEG